MCFSSLTHTHPSLTPSLSHWYTHPLSLSLSSHMQCMDHDVWLLWSCHYTVSPSFCTTLLYVYFSSQSRPCFFGLISMDQLYVLSFGLWWLELNTFWKVGPNPASFLFSSYSKHNHKCSTKFEYKWKNRWWFAWDLNHGPQDGWQRQIH